MYLRRLRIFGILQAQKYRHHGRKLSGVHTRRRNLKPMCSKGNLCKILEPKEPNEAIQLDFWGPINYLQESKKYVIVAVDRFL